jgi:hypothetical protein
MVKGIGLTRQLHCQPRSNHLSRPRNPDFSSGAVTGWVHLLEISPGARKKSVRKPAAPTKVLAGQPARTRQGFILCNTKINA